MALTITATVEFAASAPRVRLEVSDTGTPATPTVSLYRFDGVTSTAVRDAEPLTLNPDTHTGVVFDYEAPFGVPVTYTATEGGSSNAVTVTERRVWLIHPGMPALSMPVELMAGSLESEEEDVSQGIFFPLGRRDPVVITDGRRKAPSSSMIVGTETFEELRRLRDLLADAFPLLLNVPPALGLGVDSSYIAVGKTSVSRRSDIGGDYARDVTLPFQVVSRPIGLATTEDGETPPPPPPRGVRTFAQTLQEAATFEDRLTMFPTFADVQAG